MDRRTFRSKFNIEVMTKLFFDIAEERYPSADKIKQLISRLADSSTADPIKLIYIKIALLNAIRNMIKEVSPGQVYRSLQHRDDLFAAIIEALEDFEDELEELEEGLEEEEEEDL